MVGGMSVGSRGGPATIVNQSVDSDLDVIWHPRRVSFSWRICRTGFIICFLIFEFQHNPSLCPHLAADI